MKFKVKGYDHSNIARMVLNRLNVVFTIENFLDEEDIQSKEILEEIEDVLKEIL